MKRKFYLPYLREELKNRIKNFPDSLALLFVPLVSLIFKYGYYKRLKKIGKNRLDIFFNKSPELLIYSSSIFIMDSIDKTGINKEKLEEGYGILTKIYPSKSKSWEDISVDYANAYIAFFLQKI